ncbi:MAG: hypothetical protein ACLUZU_12340 [Faecalibacillus intestinalis]|uniref:hypothetical protein n=1 Tax=Faecalibacillus intestinalis TaxID=1982626 RepID=UPI00399AA260
MIKFNNSKQSISDLIDEITNSIKESFDKSKSNIFKDMIADTKLFVDWAKDYNEVDNLLHQNIIIALNNLKTVSKEELELLDADEIDSYYELVDDIEIILTKYSYCICEQVKDNIKDIINKRNERRNKSSYKPTKEDLSKLRKEYLINMIIDEEEPKKNQN